MEAAAGWEKTTFLYIGSNFLCGIGAEGEVRGAGEQGQAIAAELSGARASYRYVGEFIRRAKRDRQRVLAGGVQPGGFWRTVMKAWHILALFGLFWAVVFIDIRWKRRHGG